MATDKVPIMEVMKYAALSTNTVTEEPIDVVLMESYPHPVSNGPTCPMELQPQH